MSLLKFIPLPALIINLIGFIILACSSLLSNFWTGFIVTNSIVNIIFHAMPALFWSASFAHWITNACLLLFTSIILIRLHISWRFQWLLFLLGGSITNVIFGIILFVTHHTIAIMGASSGIAALLGAALLISILRQQIPLLIWSELFSYSLIVITDFKLSWSSQIHVIGFVLGMLIFIGNRIWHRYRVQSPQ